MKLRKAMEQYKFEKSKTNRQALNNVKVPRMLTTCPYALKMLLAKNDLIEDTMPKNHSNDHDNNQPSVHHHNSITFTAEFVKYYFGDQIVYLNFKI